MSSSSLKNKVVIITGASSGIGKALAVEFAKEGANMVLAARQYVICCEMAEELEKKYGVRVIAVATDVTKKEYCEELIIQTLRTFGKIDVLVNNAGISMRALVEDIDLGVIEKVMEVNFFGTVYCTRYALPALLESGGSVIGISSIAGYKGLPARSAYSASKFAMRGFLESLRIENLKRGLHVLIVSPGFTASNIRNTALGKDGQAQGESPLNENKIMPAEVVAQRIIKALKSKKRTLVLTAQGKITVLLSKLFPNLLDQLVFNHFAKEPDSPLK